MRKYDGDDLVEITCNKCGWADVIDSEYPHNEWDAEPYREFDLVYHYGSVLYDFSGVRFDLCEHCVEELVDGFKVPAERRDHDIMQGYTSDGTPFVYGGFEDDVEPTQERLDEMYDIIMKDDGEE